jgi:hypothetical protein
VQCAPLMRQSAAHFGTREATGTCESGSTGKHEPKNARWWRQEAPKEDRQNITLLLWGERSVLRMSRIKGILQPATSAKAARE